MRQLQQLLNAINTPGAEALRCEEHGVGTKAKSSLRMRVCAILSRERTVVATCVLYTLLQAAGPEGGWVWGGGRRGLRRGEEVTP